MHLSYCTLDQKGSSYSSFPLRLKLLLQFDWLSVILFLNLYFPSCSSQVACFFLSVPEFFSSFVYLAIESHILLLWIPWSLILFGPRFPAFLLPRGSSSDRGKHKFLFPFRHTLDAWDIEHYWVDAQEYSAQTGSLR